MSSRSIRRNSERRAKREAVRKGQLGRRAALATSAALGAGVLFAPAAIAETFPVTTTEDDDDGDCDPSDCTLREAVYDANDTTAADIVTFAAGLSGEISLDSGDENIIIDEPLEIQGPGADVLTVSGYDEAQIFYVPYADSLSVSGLTLADGYAETGVEFVGGAIEAEQTDLTIAASVLTGNRASIDGGAVYINAGSLTVTGSLFTENSALIDDGGALMADDEIEAPTNVVISDSVFTENEATQGDGGAIYIDGAEEQALIERTTVSENTAGDVGGGIAADESLESPLTIDSSTISGNDADQGGGFFLYALDDPVTIQNSTVSGNTAEFEGGGISVSGDPDDDEDITVRNSTIVGNDAGDYGGGINRNVFYANFDYYRDTVQLSSTIVADNTAGEENPDLGEDTTDEVGFELGFSLVENPGVVNIAQTPAGSNIFGVDPQLGALASNGGPTQTHAPALSSPVVDKGVANGLTTDQRGLARTGDLALFANATGGDGTDIGSAEIQAADCQGQGALKLDGSGGDDAITGTDGPDSIGGAAGNDTMNGLGGDDCVSGDEGNDRANGGAGADLIGGDEGRDRLKGGSGKDIVKGGKGKDRASGNGGKDAVKGNAGKDNLKGGGGKDKLSGAGGKDRLSGGGGKDRLKGGPGKDRIKTGGGKDRVNCGGGNDKVTVSANDRVSNNCEKVVERGR